MSTATSRPTAPRRQCRDRSRLGRAPATSLERAGAHRGGGSPRCHRSPGRSAHPRIRPPLRHREPAGFARPALRDGRAVGHCGGRCAGDAHRKASTELGRHLPATRGPIGRCRRGRGHCRGRRPERPARCWSDHGEPASRGCVAGRRRCPGCRHDLRDVVEPHRVERQRSTASLALIVIAATAFPFTWGTVIYGVLQRIILATVLAWLIAAVRHDPAGRPNADLTGAKLVEPRPRSGDESSTSAEPTTSTTPAGPPSHT